VWRDLVSLRSTPKWASKRAGKLSRHPNGSAAHGKGSGGRQLAELSRDPIHGEQWLAEK